MNSTNYFDFTDKTVVVMGGTSGINRGIAETFAKQGARVAVASRSQEKVDDTVNSLKEFGVEAMGFAADVRQSDDIVTGLAEVNKEFGDFDVLVSGAAGNFLAKASEMSVNAFKAVIDIDLMGTYHVMRAAYPYLNKLGASVINISAPQSLIAMEYQSHVCAAKAGVDMITRTLSLEWGPEGVRVNSVIPGPISETGGMDRLVGNEAQQQAVIHSVPLRRLGTKTDVGNTCLFLGSELASYVSGNLLTVDGGWAVSGALGMPG